MGVEGFWGKKKNQNEASQETPTEEKIDKRKRSFLVGAGALAASTLLPNEKVRAADLPELLRLDTHEAREVNVERIRLYAQWILQHEAALATATRKEDIEDIIYSHVPALEEHVLERTDLDYKQFIKQGGWPSQLFMWNEKRFDEQKGEWVNDPYRANSFTVNDFFISNRHVLEKFPNCTVSSAGLDISGTPLDNEAVVLPQDRANRERVQLEWDPNKTYENLHGKIVFVPTMRQQSDGTFIEELVPAVLVRITENFLYTQQNPGSFFNRGDTSVFGRELLHSYMAVVAPQDIDQDGVRSGSDIQGMSGSPVITLEDCQKGSKVVSGILWGATSSARDNRAKVSRALMFVHGPDVVGNFLEQIGKNHEPVNENIDRAKLTIKIQEALNMWRSRYGFDAITVDGLYGNGTKLAVYEFQKAVLGIRQQGSVYERGIVNEATWEHLFPGEPYVDYNALSQ